MPFSLRKKALPKGGPCCRRLQIGLDLFDHLGILRIGQLRLAGIHREHAAPLEAVPVFRHEMTMQVAAVSPYAP